MAKKDKEYFELKHVSKICPVSERKKCQCCGKRLSLRTFTGFWDMDTQGPRLKGAKAWTTSRHRDNGDLEHLTIWTGQYDGYDNLFCRVQCVRDFAEAAHQAGYRVKGN